MGHFLEVRFQKNQLYVLCGWQSVDLQHFCVATISLQHKPILVIRGLGILFIFI